MSDLLNRTVTDGIRITAVLRDDGQVGWIGYGINRREAFPGRGIALTFGGAPVRCYLHVMHTLVLRRGVLVTDESSFGLYLDDELNSCLLHYDFGLASRTWSRCSSSRSLLPAGRPGWEAAIDEHRSRFRRLQLMAAVRDDPEAAREELHRFDEEQRHQPWPARRIRRRRQRS